MAVDLLGWSRDVVLDGPHRELAVGERAVRPVVDRAPAMQQMPAAEVAILADWR